MKKWLSCLSAVALILSFIMGLPITGVLANDVSKYDQLLAEDGFIYGVNLPYLTSADEGHTFGYNSIFGLSNAYDETKADEILTNIAAVGFNCVRIPLFNKTQGLLIEADGQVVGLSEKYLDSVESILSLAKEKNLGVQAVLLPGCGEYVYESGKSVYDRVSRLIVDPAVRQQYIQKAILPVTELLEKYRDIIVGVDVCSEPETDIYDYTREYGTSSEVMTTYIRDVAQAVKSNSSLPVLASSADPENVIIRMGDYNDLGLDFVGVKAVSDIGEVRDIETLNTELPVFVTSMGAENEENVSDDFHTMNVRNFYTNAKEAGYKGAFYAAYGDESTVGYVKLINERGALRPATQAMHFLILDDQYEQQGIGDPKDQPAFLYVTSPSNLQWLGTRFAESYTVERTEDGKTWMTLCENITPSTGFIMNYSDPLIEEGKSYRYRVKAILDTGDIMTSEASNVLSAPVITCPADKNLFNTLLDWDPGFEDGKNPWEDPDWDFKKSEPHMVNGAKAGWTGTAETVGLEIVCADDDPKNVHSGKYAYKVVDSGIDDGYAAYRNFDFQLDVSKTYTFSIWYRTKDSAPRSGLVSYKPSYGNLVTGESKIFYSSLLNDDEWHLFSCTFTPSGWGSPYARFAVTTWNEDFYFDDLYLFEVDASALANNPFEENTEGYPNLSKESAPVNPAYAPLTVTPQEREVTTGGTENLLPNGSFEIASEDGMRLGDYKINNPSMYDTVNSFVSRSEEPEGVWSGNYSMKVINNGNWSGAMRYALTLEPNTDYTFSFVYKMMDAWQGAPQIGMTYSPADWNWTPILGGTAPTQSNTEALWPAYICDGNWHRYTMTFNTGDSTTFAFCWRNSISAVVYLDDLYLAKSSEAVQFTEPNESSYYGGSSITEYVTDKVLATDGKNLLAGSAQPDAVQMTANDTTTVIKTVTIKPNTNYMLSADIKGAHLNETNSGIMAFGVQSNNCYLYADATGIPTGMKATSWDNEWHRRGFVFNSGSNTTVTLAVSGAGAAFELKDFILCEAADAKPVPAAELPENPENTDPSDNPATGVSVAVLPIALCAASFVFVTALRCKKD